MKSTYLFLKKRSQQLILSLFLILMSAPQTVRASDSIILKYGFLRESVSVSELSHFAETGEMSSSLRNYFDLANQKPERIRRVLNEEIPVNGLLLSYILNTKPGEVILDMVSKYIQTPSGRASRESLRGAFVTSALPDNNVKLIEVLENYPTSEIHVEGESIVELYTDINKVVKQIPAILRQ